MKKSREAVDTCRWAAASGISLDATSAVPSAGHGPDGCAGSAGERAASLEDGVAYGGALIPDSPVTDDEARVHESPWLDSEGEQPKAVERSLCLPQQPTVEVVRLGGDDRQPPEIAVLRIYEEVVAVPDQGTRHPQRERPRRGKPRISDSLNFWRYRR